MNADFIFVNSLRKLQFDKIQSKYIEKKKLYEAYKDSLEHSKWFRSYEKIADYDFQAYRLSSDVYYYPPAKLSPFICNSVEEVNIFEPYIYVKSFYKSLMDNRMKENMERSDLQKLDISDYDFFDFDSSGKNVIKIQNWFPIYCKGVCRILGQIEGKKSKTVKVIVTGAILHYEKSENLISTLDNQYSLDGKRNIKYIRKYFHSINGSCLTKFKSLSEENWLKQIIKLWSKFDPNFFVTHDWETLAANKCSISKMSDQFLIYSLRTVRPNDIFKRSVNKLIVNEDDQYIDICNELENILKNCEENNNWEDSLLCLFKRCGQKSHILSKINKIKLNNKDKFENTSKSFDIVETNNIISYEDFSNGNKVNSTLTNFETKVVFWALLKNEKDEFLIKGVKISSKNKNKFVTIDPVLISSISKCGFSIIADKCNFQLVGPMYESAILNCYPQSENLEYFHIFQYFFTNKIADHWKEIISILDILSQCSRLRYVADKLPKSVMAEGIFKIPGPRTHNSKVNIIEESKKKKLYVKLDRIVEQNKENFESIKENIEKSERESKYFSNLNIVSKKSLDNFNDDSFDKENENRKTIRIPEKEILVLNINSQCPKVKSLSFKDNNKNNENSENYTFMSSNTCKSHSPSFNQSSYWTFQKNSEDIIDLTDDTIGCPNNDFKIDKVKTGTLPLEKKSLNRFIVPDKNNINTVNIYKSDNLIENETQSTKDNSISIKLNISNSKKEKEKFKMIFSKATHKTDVDEEINHKQDTLKSENYELIENKKMKTKKDELEFNKKEREKTIQKNKTYFNEKVFRKDHQIHLIEETKSLKENEKLKTKKNVTSSSLDIISVQDFDNINIEKVAKHKKKKERQSEKETQVPTKRLRLKETDEIQDITQSSMCNEKLIKFKPIGSDSFQKYIDETGVFSNIVRTRSGRASLPRTDARTGLSYEYENDRVFLRKGRQKIMELQN